MGDSRPGAVDQRRVDLLAGPGDDVDTVGYGADAVSGGEPRCRRMGDAVAGWADQGFTPEPSLRDLESGPSPRYGQHAGACLWAGHRRAADGDGYAGRSIGWLDGYYTQWYTQQISDQCSAGPAQSTAGILCRRTNF